ADELEYIPALATALDLAVAELLGVDAADGGAVGVLDLREVGAPLDRIALRAHDRLLAREAAAGLALGLVHQLRDQLPGASGLGRVDAVDPKHGRGIKHVAGAIADLERGARPSGEIAVAGSVNEDLAAHGKASRLGLDHQRVDAVLARHDRADREGVEQ